jgi:hypothetical protein
LSNLVLTTTKPIVFYPSEVGTSCDEMEVSPENVRHKLSTSLFVEIPDSDEMWEILCFSYKIGLVGARGGVALNFTRGFLRGVADEVADICLKKSEDRKEDKIVKYLLCLRDNLPMFLSYL